MSRSKRIKGIMVHPQTGWDPVAGEKPGATVLLRNFLLPLSVHG